MNEPHHPLKGALWAPAHSEYRPTPMGVFIAAALVNAAGKRR
jgi:periplasmic protein TonB